MTQLNLDLTVRTPMNANWSFGGNAGHASLLLRKDIQRQLQVCRDELGSRHIRCHGMLSEAMNVAQPDGSFDFTRVEQALDVLMENNLVPFLVLSPAEAPADAGRWHDLVKAFATMVDGRYGCDAREWYFEVGHDLAAAPTDRNVQDELKPYDVAARAIKEVHPEFRIGRQMSGAEVEIDAFLRHVTMPSDEFKLDVKRCDFITTRAFGADDTPAGVSERIATIRRKLTDALGADIPLICSAGSLPDGPLTFHNDECNNAAAVARAMVEMSEAVHGSLVSSISDIQGKGGQPCEPFHGGHGLLTVNDIRKAAFHAARLLGEHRGYHNQRVEVRWTDPLPGLGCLASIEEYTLRVLCWYHREPGAASAKPARFTIEGLKPSIQNAQLEVIRPAPGSAYESWVEMGRPEFPTLQSLHDLEIASHPGTIEVDFREYPPRLEPGMVMQLTISLPFEENWTD